MIDKITELLPKILAIATKVFAMVPELWNMIEFFPFRILFSWFIIGAIICYLSLKLFKNYFLSFLIHQFLILCSMLKLYINFYYEINLVSLIVFTAIWLAGILSFTVIVMNTKVEKKHRYY